MSRFSLLYGSRGEPVADSPRMRRRLASLFGELRESAGSTSAELAGLVQRELGVAVRYAGYGYSWDEFFVQSELRDVLDLVSVFHDYLKSKHQTRSASWWITEVRRIFSEENVYYRVDDEGDVHFSVDEEFERARQASLAVLQPSRYANVLAAFERAYRELDKTPPDGKEAIRATFSALEGLFKLMFDKAIRLGSKEVDTYLKPYVDQHYAEQTAALHAAQKLVGAFKEWVTGAHYYRHEQGQEEVVQPPLGLAIATVGAGAAFLRWLAELDQGTI